MLLFPIKQLYRNAPNRYKGISVSVSKLVTSKNWLLSYIRKYNNAGRFKAFRLEVAEKYALLGCYTAGSGNFFSTFRDKLPVPYLGVNNPKGFWIPDP